MKKLFAVLLAFTPGSVPFMYGQLQKALVYLLLFIFIAFFYRLSGIFGPNIFFISLLGFLLLYAGLCIFQIKAILKSTASPQLLKGFFFFIFAVVTMKVLLTHFSPGNAYSTGSNDSMDPVLPANSYVYVSLIKRAARVGDIALYDYQNAIYLGVICGIAGDKMSAQDLTLFQNDKATTCSLPGFVRSEASHTESFTVPENSYFIAKSKGIDSAFLHRAFSKNEIKGKVLFKIQEMPFASLVESYYSFALSI